MFSRVFKGSRKSSVTGSVRRNRTLSANLDPRKIPSRRNRPANRSVLNSMRRASKAVRNSMHKTRGYVGSSINSMGLTRGARRRVINKRDQARRDILENEIKNVIQGKSSQDLKQELLRNLDKKINFKIHSGDNFYTYYTCDRSRQNETMVDDYSYIINQMSLSNFSYSQEIKNILKEVKKEVDSRMHHCAPTDSRHTRY